MLDDKKLKEFLKKMEKVEGKNDFLQEVLIFLKNSGIADGVGIRLKAKGDYPYYTTLGFTNYFVKMENFLCKRAKNKKMVTDKDGCPVFECMCGAVISGKIDYKMPCFTKFGSFVTNGSTKLIEKSKESLENFHVRGRCNELGYESILLVPIPINSTNIGLIQLNSFKKNAFDNKTVTMIEEIASIIGIMLEKIDFQKQSANDDSKKIIKKNIYKIISDIQALTGKILGEKK